MRILVHVCCAPCFTYPHKNLTEKGHEVTGFWYNPNIHPYTEYRKRLHEVERYMALRPVKIIFRDEYYLERFLRGQLEAVDRGDKRCEFCISRRLEETASAARENGLNAFTTTLLESKYQPHDLIREIGERFGKEYNIEFYYEDFRTGWRASVQMSKEMDMYRQKYCGCIFSELERYKGK